MSVHSSTQRTMRGGKRPLMMGPSEMRTKASCSSQRADHATLLGPRWCAAVVRGIDFVQGAPPAAP